ncbi:Uncharacterised protein [Candidatus Norongarragalina meridionalis]|nr:Uncharacterised protein [Candidatus Norongarragalina meridionalis]
MRPPIPRELWERARRLKAREEDAARERKVAAAEFQRTFRERTLTIVTTAFGVVAALFWQSAISDMIKTYIPTTGIWQYEMIAAVLVTVMAVTAIYFIGKWTKPKEEKNS